MPRDPNDVRADLVEALPHTAVNTGSVTVVGTGLVTVIPILFSGENWDSWGQHSVSSATERITFATSGLAFLSATAIFEANAVGVRFAEIRLNGTTILTAQRADPASVGTTYFSLGTMWRMVQGDYIDLGVLQNSGGDLDVSGSLRAAMINGYK